MTASDEFDATRAYFPAAFIYELAPYLALVGPLTPTPGLTLADVVWQVAA